MTISSRTPQATKRHADGVGLTAVLTAIVATQVVILPVWFGVAFPYSLLVFEISVVLMLVAIAWSRVLRPREQAALLCLVLGFILHTILLRGDLSVLILSGSCTWGGPSPGAGLDTAAALDSFRRGFVYVSLFLIVRQLAASGARAKWLSKSVAVCGVALFALGIVAPQDSQRILGFHAVPTYDYDWLSSSMDSLLSDLSAYAYPYEAEGLPVTVDEFVVSGRPVGPLFNGNHFAGAIGAAFPVVLGLLANGLVRRGRRHVPITLPLSLGVGLSVFWLTDSRGGTLAMAISCLVFFVAARGLGQGKRLAFWVLIGAAAISLLVPALQSQREIAFFGGRAIIWLQTVETILEHPLLGTGLGNFFDLRLGSLGWQPTRWYSPHNVYLHLLVQVGLIGVLWLVAIAVLLHGSAAGERGEVAPMVGAGLLGSLVFSLAHSGIDYSPALPFNAMLAAVVAGLLFGGETRFPVRPPATKLAFGAALMPVLTTALALWLGISSLQYAYAQARLFEIKDLNATLLSRGGGGVDARDRLSVAVEQNERTCRLLPPRKDYLLSMAHAHVLLSEGTDPRHLGMAADYLRRHEAIGRRDGSVLNLQVAIRERLSEAGSP